MIATEIKKGIYWVGAIDWGLRSFHGYTTSRGSTYNAYLIIDEKITLIDNVKVGFTEEIISRISSVIDPSKIDIIISNHGEPDHSGSLPAILKLAPNAKVYTAGPIGAKILKAQYGEMDLIPVKSGDKISIGKRNLIFNLAPMVHWPDNMVTYCPEEKILFSNDIFGQHFATSKRFDSEVDLALALEEAKQYYANIVLPYTKQANKINEVVKGLDIEMIANSHGVIWREHVSEILNLYDDLINSKKKEKAVVIYDSMWGNTKQMAQTIAETFRNLGIEVFLTRVDETPNSLLITEIMDSKYVAVGSSTLNNNMLPPIAGFLCYMKGLAPVNLKYISFGSYGWGGQSIEQVDNELKSMKLEQLLPPIKQYYTPSKEDLKNLEQQIINVFK
ncbi:MAG: FprA family A-type flavoprotein [Bacilli bacterium]